MQLTDARVLVTGASGGIGSETAHLLHARGARLILHGRDPDRLADLASGTGARLVIADFADPDGPVDTARQAGPVDVLVNCAGIGLRGEFAACRPGQLDRLLAVNLRAPIALARAVLPGMCAARRGHIAFVASIAGRAGVAREAVYAATKAGLLSFAESLELELADSGVTVSTISPGAVDTGFWTARGAPYHRSVPRPISAGRVAELIVADIEAGGGDRVVPGWLAVGSTVQALAPRLYRRVALRMDPS